MLKDLIGPAKYSMDSNVQHWYFIKFCILSWNTFLMELSDKNAEIDAWEFLFFFASVYIKIGFYTVVLFWNDPSIP